MGDLCIMDDCMVWIRRDWNGVWDRGGWGRRKLVCMYVCM